MGILGTGLLTHSYLAYRTWRYAKTYKINKIAVVSMA